MAIVNTPISTDQRYQQATVFYTQTGMLNTLKRQWDFLKDPNQKDFLISSISITAGAIVFCTYLGLELGEELSNNLSLKGQEKDVVILCGGGAGFLTGVGLSVTGNALLIENTRRIKEWKKMQINNAVGDLIREEFKNDPIWSKFVCPISQDVICTPSRTPCGQVFDFNSLVQVAEQNNGIIKDIYNKTIPMPTERNPHGTKVIFYSLDACVRDAEMTIVIYKRFRHLTTQKCSEEGLSVSTKNFLVSYRNALGDFVKVLYLEGQEKINQKRLKVVMKDDATESEAEQAELTYNSEVASFKELFGKTALSNIDWDTERDWASILNQRWMNEYH